MITSVRQLAVRYVRPEPEDEERLRVVVAELQAASILRAAGIGGRPVGTCAEEKASPPDGDEAKKGKECA